MLFVTAICIIVGYLVLDNVKDGLNDMPSDTINKTLVGGLMQSGQNSFSLFDYLFIFLIAGASISLLISAYYVNTNPVYFWVSVIMLLVLILVAVGINNAYDAMSTSDQLGSTMAEFPIIQFFMDHIALYCTIMTLAGIVVFYSKRGGTSYGGY